MFVIVDDTHSTPDFFWKVSNSGMSLATLDLSQTPLFKTKAEAKKRLEEIPNDGFFKFRVAKIGILK